MTDRYQLRSDLGFTPDQRNAVLVAYDELAFMARIGRAWGFGAPTVKRLAGEARRLIAAFGERKQ